MARSFTDKNGVGTSMTDLSGVGTSMTDLQDQYATQFVDLVDGKPSIGLASQIGIIFVTQANDFLLIQ